MKTIALAMGLALCSAATTAQADGPLGVSAAAILGYTSTIDRPDDQVDPMGLALGARAGVVLPASPFYIGGLFLYHTGREVDVSLDSESGSTVRDDADSNSYMLGAELGYQLGLGPLQIRPNVGLGYYAADLDDIDEDSANAVYLSPGVNVMLSLGLLVGAEIRYNTVFHGDVEDSVSVLGSVGFSL